MEELRGKCAKCGRLCYFLGKLPAADNQFCDDHASLRQPTIKPEQRAVVEKDLEELRAARLARSIQQRDLKRRELQRKEAYMAELGTVGYDFRRT